MSFRLTHDPLSERPDLGAPEDGAVASFVGRVRNNDAGRPVESLEYEAFDQLAISEGLAILAEARGRFAISEAACTHRLGRLSIGEAAIRIDVAAPHRQAAFDACRYILDEVKKRVPIWKKEHFIGRPPEWVNSTNPPAGSAYYSRQIVLPEVGAAGQRKLGEASVLVVGAGGLGCSALQYLAGAGVGVIGVCDFDRLHESNLHRQTLYSHADVGQSKAGLAARRIESMNPFITVRAHNEAITAEILQGYDLVLDCADNFATKFLLNDACVQAGKVLIQASIYQFEGQVLLIQPGGPCLRCLWPEQPDEGCIGSCADAGVLGFVPGAFGAVQAAEAIKFILGISSPLCEGKMLILELLGYETHFIAVPRDPNCPACGAGAPAVSESASLCISAEEVSDCLLIDLRTPDEVAQRPLGSCSMVLSEVEVLSRDWRDAGRCVLVCRKGIRSRALALELREQGFENVYSLTGGAEALLRLQAR